MRLHVEKVQAGLASAFSFGFALAPLGPAPSGQTVSGHYDSAIGTAIRKPHRARDVCVIVEWRRLNLMMAYQRQ